MSSLFVADFTSGVEVTRTAMSFNPFQSATPPDDFREVCTLNVPAEIDTWQVLKDFDLCDFILAVEDRFKIL